MNTQINITVPKEWKDQLEALARIISVQESKTITHMDLIRKAIKEKYDLKKDADKNEKDI